jgi:hypothetical protein
MRNIRPELRSATLAALCLCIAPLSSVSAQSPMMSFFVTSEPMGDGGNLGGLAGADAHCQALAEEVGAGEKTWRAYLSTQDRPGEPAVNARDRIGSGPWYNFNGELIARDVAHLHGDTLELARLGNNVTKQSAVTEMGQIVPGLGDFPDPRSREWEHVRTTPFTNRHEILTGSQSDGTAFPPDIDYTCDNWTSNADPDTDQGPRVYGGAGRPNAQIGFTDRMGGGNGSWNSSHGTRGCSQTALVLTHGIGMLYCFAIDSP